MTAPSATMQTALRVDRLLRSLVGVADLRPVWNAGGALTSIHVLKASDIRDDQLVRNVVSGLKAGLGLRLAPSSVRVHITAESFEAAAPAAEPAVAVAPAAAETNGAPAAGNGASGNGANGNGSAHAAKSNGNGNGAAHAANGNGHAGNGNGHGSNGQGNGGGAHGAAQPVTRVTSATVVAPPDAGYAVRAAGVVDEPAKVRVTAPVAAAGAGPQLELMELERVGAMLRCRVTLAFGARRYSAIADAPVRPDAEAELAASVTLDALRAGGFTTARLDGLGRTVIGRHSYMVATVREPAAAAPLAGAALLGESPARAAAECVINAIAPAAAGSRI